MGSRLYDLALGRWTSPDSIIPNPGNPLDWDRYQYVRSNPVRYNDPSGHMACDGKHSGTICSSSKWKFSKQDLIDAFDYEYDVDTSLTERLK